MKKLLTAFFLIVLASCTKDQADVLQLSGCFCESVVTTNYQAAADRCNGDISIWPVYTEVSREPAIGRSCEDDGKEIKWTFNLFCSEGDKRIQGNTITTIICNEI